jgi:hypothetical protein
MAVLIGLLALGPFLHGHIGASHISGFHVDGLHAISHPAETGHAHSLNAADDESPALGVATSLPKPDDDGSLLLHAALLLALVLGLRPHQPALRLRPCAADPHTVHAYHDGWPPPALAPPALTA